MHAEMLPQVKQVNIRLIIMIMIKNICHESVLGCLCVSVDVYPKLLRTNGRHVTHKSELANYTSFKNTIHC